MKHVLIALLLAFSAFVTLNAQEEMEQTHAPNILIELFTNEYYDAINYDHYDMHVLDCYSIYLQDEGDPEASIYFRVLSDGHDLTGWLEYSDDYLVTYSDPGSYVIEAYAQAEGKLPSDVVTDCFDVLDQLIFSCYHDEGMFYKSYDGMTL